MTFSLRNLLKLILLFLVFAPPSASAQTQTPIPIRIAWQPDPNVPYYLASNKQLFEQAGLTPQHVKFLAAPPMFAALQSNSVDVADMGLGPAIIAKSQGIDIKLIAIAVDVSNSNALIVQKNRSASSPRDLKGLRIAAQRGTTPYIGLVRYLEQGGMTINDIQFVDLTAPNIIPAFRTGEIDAAWVWSPWQNMLKQMGGKVVTTNKAVGALAPQVWAVRSEYLKSNSEGLRRFISAIDNSLRQMDSSVELSTQQLMQNLNIDKPTATDVMKDSEFPTIQRQVSLDYELSITSADSNKGLKRAVRQTAEFLFSSGIIKNKVDVDDLIEALPVRSHSSPR